MATPAPTSLAELLRSAPTDRGIRSNRYRAFWSYSASSRLAVWPRGGLFNTEVTA